MSLKNPPWKATRASRQAPKPSKNTSAELDEVDVPVSRVGPCDGAEAYALLGLHGPAGADVIGERVQKFGGRPR